MLKGLDFLSALDLQVENSHNFGTDYQINACIKKVK
jgi:hypothetical protein